MIRMRVSAVLQVRDGFSGKIIEGRSMLCILDGTVVRPVSKPGGYLVLTNLAEGAHRFVIRCMGYQDEQFDLTVSADGITELYIALKPGTHYPFRMNATRLRLGGCGTESDVVWISPPSYVECKLAQTKAEPGCREFRVYCKGSPALLPIPGTYLIEDGDNSEIVVLMSLSEENGTLSQPLRREHGRSRRILPVYQYRPDANGEICTAFPAAGPVVVYPQGKTPRTIELTQPDNRFDLT